MELILDTHYKYDTFGRYYYLTTEGAELITGIDALSSVWKDSDKRLKSHGKLLKMVMTISTSGDFRKRYSRKDIVEYLQYKNLNGERDAIFYMLGELAEWAYDSNGDRITYEERNPFDVVNYMPLTIKQKGQESGLIFFGKTIYSVPEDEYQVGY